MALLSVEYDLYWLKLACSVCYTIISAGSLFKIVETIQIKSYKFLSIFVHFCPYGTLFSEIGQKIDGQKWTKMDKKNMVPPPIITYHY